MATTGPPINKMPKKKTPKLFSSLRQDPKKLEDGVWITHPDSGDQLKIRSNNCEQHLRAILELHQEMIDEAGADAKMTDEQGIEMEAKAMATGLITDWKLVDQPDMQYDPAMMAAILVDPELNDLKTWIRIESNNKVIFRPEEAGNG